MHAPLKIVMAAVVMVTGCASVQPTPRRFAQVPAASAEECALIKAALLSVVTEEPYYSKPASPPAVSYIAVSPYFAVEALDDNPHLALKDVAPVNVAGCIGASLNGPRGRVMGFTYPETLPGDEGITKEGWVSRPIINGPQATVLLNRGSCYRTTTIELVRPPSGAWRAISVRHNREEIVWSGRHPCDSWL